MCYPQKYFKNAQVFQTHSTGAKVVHYFTTKSSFWLFFSFNLFIPVSGPYPIQACQSLWEVHCFSIHYLFSINSTEKTNTTNLTGNFIHTISPAF